MAWFCYACHRIYDTEKTNCAYDSYGLAEADCELPAPLELDGMNFEFQRCIFPGENFKVYVARDTKTYENYNFSIISSKIIFEPNFNAWFAKLSNIKHEHLISCIKYGALPNGDYYVLSERPAGETLLEALQTDGEMKAKICVFVADQLLDTLIDLKKQDIFHGNLMPSKCLLVEEHDKPNLLKVGGLSPPDKCFTNLEDKPGKRYPEIVSPLYISPERVKGEAPSEASEIYSVGAVMYECLSGIPAYSAKTREELLKKHEEGQLLPLRGVAPELAIPELIDNFILKAMSKEPKNRFSSFEEMKERLLDAAEGSRIYVLEDDDTEFMPPVIYKRLTQENPVLTLEKIQEIEEAQKEAEEEQKVKAELQEKAEESKNSSNMLFGLAIVIAIVLGFLLLSQR